MFEDSIIGEGEKGKLVIISGPSGSGKTSICNLLAKNPKIKQYGFLYYEKAQGW